MTVKNRELGEMWLRQAAQYMRKEEARWRKAYRTPYMQDQSVPLADAFGEAAALMENRADEQAARMAAKAAADV